MIPADPQAEDLVRELLDDQDRQAGGRDPADVVVQLLDDDRASPIESSSMSSTAGSGRERAAIESICCSPTGQRSRGLLAPFTQARELREREIGDVVVGVTGVGSHAQVLATVRFGKIPRPPDQQTPARASASGDTPVTSRLQRKNPPELGAI